MFKLKPAFFVFSICLLISVISSYASEESLTITTYYPSPYGSYHELRSQRIAIGDTYINGATYSWDNGTINTDADLVVEGNVGIGTTAPSATLDVVGGIQAQVTNVDSRTGFTIRNPNGFATIYSSGALGNGLGFYTNSDEANVKMSIDSNGNVGIGTTAPSQKLEVAGNIFVSGTISGGGLGQRNCGYSEWARSTYCPAGQYAAGVQVGSEENANSLRIRFLCCTP